jgi:hypothetical protein
VLLAARAAHLFFVVLLAPPPPRGASDLGWLCSDGRGQGHTPAALSRPCKDGSWRSESPNRGPPKTRIEIRWRP